MSRLVLLSPAPGSGKTTVASLIATRLGGAILSRLGDDGNAVADASLFSKLSESGSETDVAEAPGGDALAAGDRRAIVVADAALHSTDVADFCRSVGERLIGVILNRVPARRRDRVVSAIEALGVGVLTVPEDEVLATPSLGEVAEALEATTVSFESIGTRPLDGAVIASISADPGQGYFVHRKAGCVIVRSDKPDLQLAALNAGATCLIVTGGLPLLGYVKERAEADEIPLIRTRMETGDAVHGIETLYSSGPFSGSAEKLSRLAELTRDFDASKLLSA